MKYFLSLISLVLLLSCSSNDDTNDSGDDNDQGETQETLLLKKVYKNDELIREYGYFADDKLKSQEGIMLNDESIELHYEYIADTIIISTINVDVSQEPVSIQKSYLINSTTSRTNLYNSQNDLFRYFIYTFNNNACGPIIYEDFSYDGTLIASKYFNFIDENCSVNTIYEGFGYKNSTLINDNKKSAFESVTSSITRQEVIHNDIEVRVWGEDDQLINARSFNSEYEYNSDNYPTKETRSYLDGTIQNYTFEYY